MKAKKLYSRQPDYAVPPGETLREVIDSLGITHKEFAARVDVTEQSLHQLLIGQQPLLSETACRLEIVTGVPAHFWNNLETQYRELCK